MFHLISICNFALLFFLLSHTIRFYANIKLNSLIFLREDIISSLKQSVATLLPKSKDSDNNEESTQAHFLSWKTYNLGAPGCSDVITPTLLWLQETSKRPSSYSSNNIVLDAWNLSIPTCVIYQQPLVSYWDYILHSIFVQYDCSSRCLLKYCKCVALCHMKN